MATDSAVIAKLGVGRGEGRPIGWWGVVMLTITEAMLFALLLFTWYYLRAQAPQWPPEGIPTPELFRPTVRSALLFFSSATMSFADRGIRKGKRWRMFAGLIATFALASVFMAGHINEMLILPDEFTWSTNAYGSARYVILNFHAAHLAVGMALLVYAFCTGVAGRFDEHRYLGLSVTSIYWHFVDVVWVFVFGSLYVLPNLSTTP